MAWCPQCKNEYREGIKVCVDCGCDLIEDEQYDDLVPLTFGDEAQLNVFKKFFEFNKLKGVTVKLDEQSENYVLYVREGDKNAAGKLLRVFLEQEFLRKQEAAAREAYMGESAEEWENVEGQENEALANSNGKTPNSASAAPGVYRNSSERAEDNRSSAWTLMIVGGIGLVVMILSIAGIIPLRLGNPYMFYGVMCTVFFLFVVMGVVSMKNAKLFAKKAESENTLRDTMTKWYQENLKAAAIDAAIATEDVPEELLYFNRVQKMKDMFNHQFINVDQVFLEHFIDEEVYDFVFSEEE